MSWYFEDEVIDKIDDQYAAMVYVITNLLTGRKYIGLKTTKSPKWRQVKGKKKRSMVESDWKTYWSSSEELKADVLQYGEANFRREIIHMCPNKGIANYLEAREQMDARVLEHPELYYNSIVNCRVHRNHIKKLTQ